MEAVYFHSEVPSPLGTLFFLRQKETISQRKLYLKELFYQAINIIKGAGQLSELSGAFLCRFLSQYIENYRPRAPPHFLHVTRYQKFMKMEE